MADEATSSNSQSSAVQAGQPSLASSAAASASDSSQTTQNSNNSQQTPQPVKAERPDWIPETDWDGDKGTFKPEFGQKYKELATFKATEDSRRLTLPQKPDDYKVETTKNFQVPRGIEFKLDEKNPLVPQARQLMHDIDTGKVSGQEAFSRMLELHAAGEVSRVQAFETAKAAEIAKLGATGTARVTAVQEFLSAQLGPDMAKHMAAMLVTARHVEGFEKLMANYRSQGAGSFTQSHRETAQQNGKIPGYESMTYEQRRFAQDRERAASAAR